MPRSIIRTLLRGQPTTRPLFIPLIFSLAARIEEIPIPIFMSNPTKIANSLSALHQRLNTDGVVCYFDLSLVAEALGCQLSWNTIPPAITRPGKELLLTNLRLNSQQLKARGRIPVALEVVQRLTITLRNGPGFLVGLPGPLRLATQLFGQDFMAQLAAEEDEALESFTLLTELFHNLALDFSLAGTHILFIDEKAVSVTLWDQWETAMESTWNAIRFHNTLPMLRFNSQEPIIPMAGNPLLCIAPYTYDALPIPELSFAVALSPEATEQGQQEAVLRWTSSKQCVMITTNGEIPYQSEIQTLPQRITLLRSTVMSKS